MIKEMSPYEEDSREQENLESISKVFKRLSPNEKMLCKMIAERAAPMMRDLRKRLHPKDPIIEPNFSILLADVYVAHMSRKMKLLQWLMSDDILFMQDMVQILNYVDREKCIVHKDVKLWFANE